MQKKQLETVSGIVRVLTYRNDNNGFTIAKIEPKGGGKRIAVKGFIKHLAVGETVVLGGYWKDDPKWGPTFQFESYEYVLPETLDGIKNYLASTFMKGIGPKTADRIVETFGKDTIDILEKEPERLREVDGLSKKQIASLMSGWDRHKHIRDVMIFLRSHTISEAFATRIYEKYGDDTVNVMRTQPYRLIEDIRGIGFIKADQLAMKIGLATDSPDRIRAGVLHCLSEMADNGHVYAERETLIETAVEKLDLDASKINDMIEHLAQVRDIVIEDSRTYLRELYRRETDLADRLKTILAHPGQLAKPKQEAVEGMIADIEKSRGIDFAEKQREAIVKSALSKVMVLTGGPGTGKTTTVQGIIDIFRKLRMPVLLCAPTGRAAKRLSESSGMEAKTIHRLLEFNPMNGRFNKNMGEPLSAHAIIMDEASMVDTVLMDDFLNAVSDYTTLVIVGDIDQLPSIGPGNVLRDIIDSHAVPTVRLTEIFRQAKASRIVRSAHLINQGKMPMTDNDHRGNFFFIQETLPVKVAETLVDMVARRLPSRYGFDPIEDIQVLSPMHKSETGVENLNNMLRERLNPPGPRKAEVRNGFKLFREGDKVMQVRNNYDKLVFNGDIGRVVRIEKGPKMTVRFENEVLYEEGDLDELVPAYAVSVHKSQGSEFRCVVMPVTTQHFIMLKRNLLYTAVTRAKEMAALVGDFKALAISVKNDQVAERFTSLRERLKG